MSEKKKTVTSEEVKEARELTEEELEQVSGGGLATSRDALRIQDEQMGWSGRPALENPSSLFWRNHHVER